MSYDTLCERCTLRYLTVLRLWAIRIRSLVLPHLHQNCKSFSSLCSWSKANSKRRVFTCNTFYLDKAYGNNTYAYLFSVPPAIHGQDVPYTYFNGPNPDVVTPIAIALQEYLTNFAEFGTPNEGGVPFFPLYGPGAIVQNLNITGISQIMDPAANSRCNWWQKGLYY